MRSPAWLAIDLGTTHTVAVIGRGDQRPRALLFDDSPLLSSGVFLDTAGVLHTGNDARRLSRTQPDRFEPYPKRRIDDGSVLLGDRDLPVSRLFAAILRRVASEASGMRPENVVLTHPADWGPVRRAVLTAAASEAGFDEVRLLAEPIAAATYCTRELEREIPGSGSVAIFDFGGGTFDVAVVGRNDSGGWRTLATGGLDDLGGLDVDSAIVGYLGQVVSGRDADLWRRLDQPAGAVDRRDRQSFWAEVRAGKEMLSRTSTAPVALPGDDMVNVHVTRDELTGLAGPLVARAVDETRRTLERAGVEPAALSMLLLVGGSSRMPQVSAALHAKLGVAPFVPEQPELPVAYGALLYAMSQVEELTSQPHVTTGPVTPQSYPTVVASPGTDSMGPGVFVPAAVSNDRGRLAIPVVVTLVVVLMVIAVAGVNLVLNGDENPIDGLWAGEKAEPVDDEGPAELRQLFDWQLSGGGATAVAASPELVVVGDVTLGGTELTALTVPDGGELWSESYELEPTDLYLTVVDDLLIVDAASSATDSGDDMRAVVSLSDGELLWKRPWRDRLDVAVYDSDLIIEQRHGIYDNMTARVDLTTGDEVWQEDGPDGLFVIDESRVRAVTYWDDGEAGEGRLLPDSQSLYDNLVAGGEIVDLDPDTGEGQVRDAATGKATRSGELPLDGNLWTAFEDFAVGALSPSESPGRAVLAGFALDDLDRAWELPFDAGARIERVKPCGPGLVCAAVNTSGDNDGHHTVAVDVATGEEAWTLPVEWSVAEGWYTTHDGLVIGDQVFDTVETAQLLDFDGNVSRSGETFVYASAVRDGLVVFHMSSSENPSIKQVIVVDTATGESTAPAVIGGDRAKATVVVDGLVVVLTSVDEVAVFDSDPA